jgi:8-oxo-dGTP diphosphatase
VNETEPVARGAPTSPHQVVAGMLIRAHAVLLCHRSIERAWYPDVWDLPGGHIETGESPTDALVRELREEVGVTLLEPLGDHSFSRSTEEFQMRVWTTRRWSGSAANCAPEEHDAIGWFSASDAAALRLADPSYRSWILEALSDA